MAERISRRELGHLKGLADSRRYLLNRGRTVVDPQCSLACSRNSPRPLLFFKGPKASARKGSSVILLVLLGFHAGFQAVQGNKAQASVRLGITVQAFCTSFWGVNIYQRVSRVFRVFGETYGCIAAGTLHIWRTFQKVYWGNDDLAGGASIHTNSTRKLLKIIGDLEKSRISHLQPLAKKTPCGAKRSNNLHNKTTKLNQAAS
ncbi:hypothetical protein [Synechococcus sp. CBW1108]|uniref:hypothetical protein n=1 Tax=Synechococcus sp. CBW1108 TaxID=1353147 RepID=UPI0018CFE9CB|nr:hypothetical protein [Synechococcus sp. CBW1108]QPN69836.1 hypothetical protein H8F27_15535 [Synechococcus sp. CBW1108]